MVGFHAINLTDVLFHQLRSKLAEGPYCRRSVDGLIIGRDNYQCCTTVGLFTLLLATVSCLHHLRDLFNPTNMTQGQYYSSLPFNLVCTISIRPCASEGLLIDEKCWLFYNG